MATTNIGIIPDTHIPFEHKNSLDFCYETFKKYKCNKIIHIGDVLDFHSISNHDHNPDGFSPKQEMDEAKKHLEKWYKAFPKVDVCIGNHDERVERACWKYGLSAHYFKDLKDIIGFPKKWNYTFDSYTFGIRFFHGMGYGGDFAHAKAVKENQCSIVMGHLHSNAGVMWTANERNRCFGLAVGCLIDRSSYAFKYGRDFRKKPIIGCGVVLDNGKYPMFIPMDL